MNSEIQNQPDQPIDFQDHTILIVDDSPANLGVVFDFLDNLGFTIMVAQDGESSLEKVRFALPDIILLDALMPGLDGFQVCRRLKANPDTQDIPVIFMTGLSSIEDKIRGFQAGAVDYVTKPVQEEELLARVVTHLRLRKLTQNLQQTNERLQQEITARIRSEAALARYRDQLEAQVQRRTQELFQANQRLQELTTRVTEIEENERRRLGRELHDRVGQDLGLLNINLNIVQNSLPPGVDPTLHTRLEDSLALIEQVAKQVYDVMAELRSPVLDEYGLVAALKWYSAHFSTRTGVEVRVHGTENGPRFSLATESALFRIAQEALTNVAKHAQASQVTVTVEQQDRDRVRLCIVDDGVGFDPAIPKAPGDGQGWGIISMTERAEAIGGRCTIQTGVNRGTQVTVEAPA